MREKLTEWVTVMAFSEALQTKLLKCKKGEAIMVMGNVTRKPYKTQAGEERIDTIIADSLMAASASATETAGGAPKTRRTRTHRPPARRQRTRSGPSGRVPLPPETTVSAVADGQGEGPQCRQ